MLMLGVEEGDYIMIGDDIKVRVVKTGSVFRLGIEAPKELNILRKIVLNLAREYKAKTGSKEPISKVLKKNLFDLNNLAHFLDFFKKVSLVN